MLEFNKKIINIKNPTTGEWEQIPALQGEKGDNKVGYGNCSTEADVAEKIVTVDDPNWKLEVGSLIMVRFSVANSASNVTLNVNNTGAYGIRTTGESSYTGTSTTYTGAVNRGLTYMFDGSYWQWISSGAYPSSATNLSLGQGYATCSTAASTKAKTASLSSYTLSTGGIVAVRFSYDVPAGATLNINSKGAKAIYHKNAAITDGVIKAGDTATFIYSTYYRLISIDRDYATKEYVDEAIESIDVTNQLTNYALKTELPTKTSQLTNDSGYLTSIPSEYVTDEELNAKGYAVTGHTHSQYASTSYVQSQIANLTSGSNVPSYVLTEAEMIANKVIEKRNAYSLVVTAMSDLHTDGKDTSATGVLHAFQGINEIDKITEVDLVTIHGDVCVGYMTEEYQEAFKYVKTCMNEITKNIPLIHMQGNHDDLNDDTTEVARQKYYRYIGSNNKDVVTDFNARYGIYGYKDFDDLRIRYIYVNSADGSENEVNNNNWITKGQFNWFINTALDFSNKEGAEDWQWIVGTHHPLNSNNIMKAFKDILVAYNNRTSGSYSYNNIVDGTTKISYDFTNAKQRLLCHLHGHIHNFRTDWYDNVLSITVPNACFGRNNEYGTSSSYGDDVHQSLGDPDENGVQRQFNKTSNTANDTAFVALVIDGRVDNKIYAYCYGAGIDREIDLTTKEIKYIDKVVDDTPVEPDTPTIPSDDVIRKSIDIDGNIYNGVGYKENSYIYSDGDTAGTISTRNGVTVTGFIPMTQGSSMTATGERIIELYNINAVPTEGNLRIACYDKDFACVGVRTGAAFATETTSVPKVITTTNDSGYIATLDISAFSYSCKHNRGKDVAYIRICSPGMSDNSYILIKSNSASGGDTVAPELFTNLVSTSIDSQGNIYNGTGYKADYRGNSSGTETQLDGAIVSGFIPYNNEVIKVYGSSNSNHSAVGYYVNFYDSSFAHLVTIPGGSGLEAVEGYYLWTLDPSSTNTTQQNAISQAKYIRASMPNCAPGNFAVGLLTPQPTNFVTTSIDASGATFGYQDGKYVSSSGNSVSAKTGYVATGFMELPRTFYVKGAEWVEGDTSCRMVSYTEAFEKVGAIYGNNQHDGTNGLTLTRMDNGVLKFELKETNAGFKTGAYKYIRMSFKGTGENLIISDEELS